MTDNLTRILEEFDRLKGQFVITDSHKIQRLIAVGTDEMDYYWITYDGRKIYWNTCVGKVVQLKGKLDDRDYNEFIRLAKLNHFDQSTLWGEKWDKFADFNRDHIDELLTLEPNHEFLVEPYLELN